MNKMLIHFHKKSPDILMGLFYMHCFAFALCLFKLDEYELYDL